MKQFNRYGPRISPRWQNNEGVAALRHRVQRLEEREEDVLRKQWRLEERERELVGVVEQVNAATALNEEVQGVLERTEAKIVAREAELLARERACITREDESRKREAASAMLDAQEAQRLVDAAAEWLVDHINKTQCDHACEIISAGEAAGHPSFALYYALTAYIIADCDCDRIEEDE